MRRRLQLRRPILWAAVAGAIAAVVSGSGAASTTYTHGYDISWPQCDGTRPSALPSSDATYVVLGLTHGAGHTSNPCLAGQVAWAKAHHVLAGAYLVPSYPSARDQANASTGPAGDCGDPSCRRENDGAKQAADALAVMKDAGLAAPMVWVDVEFRHYRSWSKSSSANADVIRGVFLGLEAAHVPYGVYTTSYMWKKIVGGWRVDVPNWLPGGSSKPADARAICRATGTGGTTWLGQYTRHFDEDLTCPAMDSTPGHPGPLWPYRHTTLTPGASGDAVTAMQRALGTVQITGTYDDQTLAVVLAFQAAHQLPVGSTFDDDDWKALGADDLVGGHGFLLPEMVAPVS